MKNVFIYGAGGLGRDTLEIASKNNNISILGFIDDYKAGSIINGKKVYKYEEVKTDYDNFFIVLAFGDPLLKNKIYKKIICDNDNVKFTNIISKDSFISSTAKIGTGCIIYPGVFIGANVVINDNVIICGNSSIGHDAVINDMCSIAFNCSIGGYTTIGNTTFVGSGSHIKDELQIGNNNIIGINSNVIKTLPSNIVYYNKITSIFKDNNKSGVF